MSLSGQTDLQYGEGINHNLLGFMGRLSGTVIDLGCGTGGWSDNLRELGAERILGVEPTDGAIVARGRYDEVIQCVLEDVPTSFYSGVSAVILADVLEHLTDPWATLRNIHDAVPSGCSLFISLPNLQNYRLLLPALLNGRFDYSDEGGLMDRGHLRWFTQATLGSSAREAGWNIEVQGGYILGRIAAASMRLSRNKSGPLVYHQLHLHARA